MTDSILKWRFVRIQTSEGERYYWDLVRADGTVVERIPADFAPPRKPTPPAPVSNKAEHKADPESTA